MPQHDYSSQGRRVILTKTALAVQSKITHHHAQPIHRTACTEYQNVVNAGHAAAVERFGGAAGDAYTHLSAHGIRKGKGERSFAELRLRQRYLHHIVRGHGCAASTY